MPSEQIASQKLSLNSSTIYRLKTTIKCAKSLILPINSLKGVMHWLIQRKHFAHKT